MAYGQILGQTQDLSQFVTKDEASQNFVSKNDGMLWTQIAHWTTNGTQRYTFTSIPYAFKLSVAVLSSSSSANETTLQIGDSSSIKLTRVVIPINITINFFLPVQYIYSISNNAIVIEGSISGNNNSFYAHINYNAPTEIFFTENNQPFSSATLYATF